eukprot:PITA_05950
MCTYLAPLFPVINIDPFTKWGIDFTTCNPPSVGNHKYTIVAIDYFTKWVEAMPTFKNNNETMALFLFNQVIPQFGIPKEVVTDHGSHFQNQLMSELALNLGFQQENSSPYYPQANGLESIFPVECGIPSLQLVVELSPETSSLEERLIHLEHLDELHQDAATINEAHKKRVKTQYDKAIHPRNFSEGDLVLVYDQDKYTLGACKFNFMWYGPFIVERVLKKGYYELIDIEGNKLAEP